MRPDAPGNRKLIRELLDNDRGLFYSSSIQILKLSTDSRGVQYLVALLVANGMLLEAICDPALSREQAFARDALPSGSIPRPTPAWRAALPTARPVREPW